MHIDKSILFSFYLKAYVRVSKLTMADVLTSDMIKLARTFVKHVYVLPQEFNATVYVSFLKRYATYMKSVTLGSMITECSYFTSQSKATMLSVVSDTEATAAESSWLGGSDTKSASLNVSMECGVYQEQATGGRRVGVRGPQPAYNSDGATWEQLTRARPVPIGVTLGPIVDLMIEEFLPEIQNISIIRENTIRAYPLYCNITNECYQVFFYFK